MLWVVKKINAPQAAWTVTAGDPAEATFRVHRSITGRRPRHLDATDEWVQMDNNLYAHAIWIGETAADNQKTPRKIWTDPSEESQSA